MEKVLWKQVVYVYLTPSGTCPYPLGSSWSCVHLCVPITNSCSSLPYGFLLPQAWPCARQCWEDWRDKIFQSNDRLELLGQTKPLSHSTGGTTLKNIGDLSWGPQMDWVLAAYIGNLIIYTLFWLPFLPHLNAPQPTCTSWKQLPNKLLAPS